MTGRALGYRLLGRGFDYLLHLRPAEWPIMAAHTTLGYLLAVGLAGAAGPTLGVAALGIALWVVPLNGGTLAINSAFDKDEGDVAYLRQPPPPPKHLFWFGLVLMLLGDLVSAYTMPKTYRALYGSCLMLSVLYSVPPFRLKAVAGADWVINLLGFGAMTPMAGWATTGRPLDGWIVCVTIGFGALFAALYPLTQLYQFEEDQRRGDRTFALVVGLTRSLDVALACAALAFLAFAVAGEQAGWGSDPLRWGALAVAAAAWGAVLVPWRRRARAMTPAEHQRGMHLALGAWAVTDLAALVGWGR
ncbi:MAG: UbiA family prenyltransferase [Gemmatimonadales bacterium]|nr:UbiA family prenyltransferase [Gemmatimonadales bacterium]